MRTTAKDKEYNRAEKPDSGTQNLLNIKVVELDLAQAVPSADNS